MGTPTALTGAFDLADDIDDFRVTLVAGQRYLFTLIGNGSTPLLAIRGSFDSALDADYFRVWLVQGQRYHFDVIGSGSNAQAFPSLELFAPGSTEFVSAPFQSGSSGGDGGASLTLVAQLTGYYILLPVGDFGSFSSPQGYTVRAGAIAADDHADRAAQGTRCSRPRPAPPLICC